MTADPEPAAAQQTYTTGTGDDSVDTGSTRNVGPGSPRNIGPKEDNDRTAAPGADPGFGTSLFGMAGRAPAKAPAGDAPAGDLPVRDRERYEFGDEHARGGLGKIMLAHDRELDRKVAVKELLRQGNTAQARFVREAMITARLEHPAIVPVHEAGRWPSGEPFYAMKLVSGRSLSEVIKDTKTLEERLALLPNIIAVADAIAYAHSELVIHRDLKPSNVMVGAYGETVVIDWGLAKDLTRPDEAADLLAGPYRTPAENGLTMVGAVLGTPAYMPPEQADGLPVDERADVYALGAMLYHLLSGTAPYAASNSKDALAAVLDGPPDPVDECVGGVPADLAAIVGKAMAREPRDRYRTAEELAEDLKRFQNGRLVEAHHYSRTQLVTRWLGRHRGAVAASAVALVVVVAIGVLSVRSIISERDEAQVARDLARDRENTLVLTHARRSIDSDPTEAIAWLKTYTGNDWEEVRNIAAVAASYPVASHVLKREAGVADIAMGPNDRFVVSSSFGANLHLWDADSGSDTVIAQRLSEHALLALSSNGEHLAYDSAAGLIFLRDMRTGQVKTLEGCEGPPKALEISPSGNWLACVGADSTVHRWNTSSEKHLVSPMAGPVHQVAFSPDSKSLAIAADGIVYLASAKETKPIAFHRAAVAFTDAKFSPDGNFLAVSSDHGQILIWTLATGVLKELRPHEGKVQQLAFSHAGRFLASSGVDSTVRVYDTGTGSSRVVHKHAGRAGGLAFSPDDRLLASGGDDGHVLVTETGTDTHWIMRGHRRALFAPIVFSPTGGLLVSGDEGGSGASLRIWPTPSRKSKGNRSPGELNAELGGGTGRA